MDILKDDELTKCYAIIQLQQRTIEDQSKLIKHLEELLKHKAHIIDNNKE